VDAVDANVYTLICPKNAASAETDKFYAVKAVLPTTMQETLRLQGRLVIVAIPEPPDGGAPPAQ